MVFRAKEWLYIYVYRYFHRQPDQCVVGEVPTATNMSIHGNLRVTKLKTKSLFHCNDLSRRRKRVVLVFVYVLFSRLRQYYQQIVVITTGTEILRFSARDKQCNHVLFLKTLRRVLYHNSKYHELLFSKSELFLLN